MYQKSATDFCKRNTYREAKSFLIFFANANGHKVASDVIAPYLISFFSFRVSCFEKFRLRRQSRDFFSTISAYRSCSRRYHQSLFETKEQSSRLQFDTADCLRTVLSRRHLRAFFKITMSVFKQSVSVALNHRELVTM